MSPERKQNTPGGFFRGTKENRRLISEVAQLGNIEFSPSQMLGLFKLESDSDALNDFVMANFPHAIISSSLGVAIKASDINVFIDFMDKVDPGIILDMQSDETKRTHDRLHAPDIKP